MARLSWPPDVEAERSVVVPVPLAPQRLRERGYNQSALLAAELANFWKVPMRELLIRNRATQTQTQLTPGERLHNVAGAFTVVAPKNELLRQHVILVDDVVTTAATLNSCATALYENGARIISYVTFGRARAAGDRL
jgi:ComF family protein